jgi:hypothetical protein
MVSVCFERQKGDGGRVGNFGDSPLCSEVRVCELACPRLTSLLGIAVEGAADRVLRAVLEASNGGFKAYLFRVRGFLNFGT